MCKGIYVLGNTYVRKNRVQKYMRKTKILKKEIQEDLSK